MTVQRTMFQLPLTATERALVRGIACLCHVVAEQHQDLVDGGHYGRPVPQHSSATPESAFWEYMGNDGFDDEGAPEEAATLLWNLMKPHLDEWKKIDEEGEYADKLLDLQRQLDDKRITYEEYVARRDALQSAEEQDEIDDAEQHKREFDMRDRNDEESGV